MAHRRQKPGSVSGKVFNVSEATDTGRTFVRIDPAHGASDFGFTMRCIIS